MSILTTERIKSYAAMVINTYFINDISTIMVSYIGNDENEFIDWMLNWINDRREITRELITVHMPCDVHLTKNGTRVLYTQCIIITYNSDMHSLCNVNLYAHNDFKIGMNRFTHPVTLILDCVDYNILYKQLLSEWRDPETAKYVSKFMCKLVADANKWRVTIPQMAQIQ